MVLRNLDGPHPNSWRPDQNKRLVSLQQERILQQTAFEFHPQHWFFVVLSRLAFGVELGKPPGWSVSVTHCQWIAWLLSNYSRDADISQGTYFPHLAPSSRVLEREGMWLSLFPVTNCFWVGESGRRKIIPSFPTSIVSIKPHVYLDGAWKVRGWVHYASSDTEDLFSTECFLPSDSN